MTFDEAEKILFGIPKLFNPRYNAYIVSSRYCVGVRPTASYEILVNMNCINICHEIYALNRYRFKRYCQASQQHMLKSFSSQLIHAVRTPIDNIPIEIALCMDDHLETLEFKSFEDLIVNIDLNVVG